MKVILREDKSGVSEVIGTILILAMTVVLFSVIIVWVTSIPTPIAQTRLDIQATMLPIYLGAVEVGVNITLLHQGGESLQPIPTVIYVSAQRGTSPPTTDVVILHRYNGLLATPSGILDGTDSVWDIGERWAYKNYLLHSTDRITITIVDIQKSLVVWSSQITAPAGTRPPVFVNVWTDGIPSTPIIDPVQANLGFALYAKVVDPDGDLDPNSVNATITAWYGTFDPCTSPQKMYDDGTHGDQVAGDGVFTFDYKSRCLSAPLPPLGWDGTIIVLNAKDFQKHLTTTRIVLHVVPQTSGGGTQTIPSQLWQYIGFIQIRAGEVWFTHMGDVVGASDYVGASGQFPLGRVQVTDLNGGGGALFHLKMTNHGNRTVFVDGWTVEAFRSAGSSNVFTIYIVKPGDSTRPANSGGVGAYPGIPTQFTDFQYAQYFDINPLNQETGGAPVVILAVSKTAFALQCCQTWRTDSYFPSILVSGMSGPVNMTYAQLTNSANPCNGGVGINYNPYTHLNDPNPTCRTQWYAQVIPFIGMTAY